MKSGAGTVALYPCQYMAAQSLTITVWYVIYIQEPIEAQVICYIVV